MNDCRYIRTKPKKLKRFIEDNTSQDTLDSAVDGEADKKLSNGYIRDRSAEKTKITQNRFIRDRRLEKSSVSKFETIFSDAREQHGPLKRVITVLIYLYIASLYVLAYSTKYNIISRGLFILLLGTTVINVLMSGKILKVKIPDILMLLFGVYASLSSFWVVSDVDVLSTVSTIIQIIVLYYVIRINAYSKNDIRTFLYALVAGTTVMCLYTIMYYGIGTIISTILTGGRIGDEISQMNAIGVNCSILTTICLYFALYENRYWFYALVPISLFVQFGCNSRKGFALVFIGVFLMFFFRAGKMKVFIIIGSVIFIYVFVLLCYKYQESNLFFRRMYRLIMMIFGDDEGDESSFVRSQMMQYGIQLFKEKPILGYGPAQFEYKYSLLTGMRRPPHSTYIQFLVSFGLIGFTAFYSNYIYYLYNFIYMFRRRMKYGVLFFTLLILMIVNDFGANMLTNKFLYIFAALFASYSDLIKRDYGDEFIEDNMKRGFRQSKFEKSRSNV